MSPIPQQTLAARLLAQNPKQITHLWIKELTRFHKMFAGYTTTVSFVSAVTYPGGFLEAREGKTGKQLTLATSALEHFFFLTNTTTNTIYGEIAHAL